MNRTLGFFLGSAAVFGMLVLILGQPVSLAPPVNRDTYRADGTTITAPIQIPKPKPVRSTQSPQHNTTLPSDVIPAAIEQAAISPAQLPASSTAMQSASSVPTESVASAGVTEFPDENRLAESFVESGSATRSVAQANIEPIQEVINPVQPDVSTTFAAAQSDTATAQPDVEWLRVWEPFHSELSANAFARRLERVTGLDYRVVKTEAAQYHVVMAYQSEEQRTVNLSLIEEATGLHIDGGKL